MFSPTCAIIFHLAARTESGREGEREGGREGETERTHRVCPCSLQGNYSLQVHDGRVAVQGGDGGGRGGRERARDRWTARQKEEETLEAKGERKVSEQAQMAQVRGEHVAEEQTPTLYVSVLFGRS